MVNITTTPERRQIARTLVFPPHLSAYVDWESIGRTARELGSHFEVRTAEDDSYTITFFWTYAD